MTVIDSCAHTVGYPLPDDAATSKSQTIFNPEARQTVVNVLNSLHPELKDISDYLHANPELAWNETKAHHKITNYLTTKGYTVTDVSEYPTAFRVAHSRGNGGPVFGLNSEYDALPGIGHACGHNLIAICGIGAFLAVAAAMDKHNIEGTVVLIGTPAEEKGSGKIDLLKAGAYKDLEACMMLHPAKGPMTGTGAAVVGTFALRHLTIEYFGKPAHAGMAPWEGVNALDAATIAYASISALRQQLKSETRVHGVITDGGSAPNVIPAHTELKYIVRATTDKEVGKTLDKVVACFEGAAQVSGCKVKISVTDPVAELRNERTLATEFAHVMQDVFGAKVILALDKPYGGSTDFGNVTHVLPGCHPVFNIEADGLNHTPEFTAGAGSADSVAEAIKHTIGMACTGMRFLADPEFATQVKRSWESMMTKVNIE